MSNNFHKTPVLKKISIVNKATKQRIALKKIEGVPVLKFLQRLALDFPCNFSCNFFQGLSYRQMYRKFKKIVLGLLAHVTPSIFFSRILRSEL